MAANDSRYDKDTATVWVYRDFDKAKTLVPKGELKGWVKQRKEGKTRDGEPLEHVNYVFADKATAEYNHQPLSFTDIGVYTGDLDNPKPYESDEGSPDFDTREDFGIE